MATNQHDVAETIGNLKAKLGDRLARLRLSRNLTRAQLAVDTGTSERTLARLEAGEGGTLDSFLRVMLALDLESNLLSMLPEPDVRPFGRVKLKVRERQRARPRKAETKPTSQ